MERLSRRRVFTSVLGLAALALVGCGSGGSDNFRLPTPTPTPSSNPGGTGRVRVIQTSPNAPNINVLVDGASVLSDLPYRGVSDYFPVSAGSRTLRLSPVNGSSAVLESVITVKANTDQTLLAVGRLPNVTVLVRDDNNAPPAAGNVRLRLVHASPGLGNIDVYATGVAPQDEDITTIEPTAGNVAFRSSTNEVDFPAGTYRVRVTPAGSKTVTLDTGAITLTAGGIYTGLAVGDPDNGQPGAVMLVKDN